MTAYGGGETLDGVAQGNQFAVEEVRGLGDEDDGDVLPGRPVQCLLRFDDFVQLAVYQQGAGRVRRVGFAFAIVVAHGRTHQQQ